MKTPKKSKLHAFTFKPGTKRNESITAQKRSFFTQLLEAKKLSKAVIFYNQKKTIASLEKLLAKSSINTILIDKNTPKEAYKKIKDDFIKQAHSLILCTDASIEHLKDLQKDIKLVVHFDLPKNSASFFLRHEFASSSEAYFLISPEDKNHIEDWLTHDDIHIRLGRLKGHRNINIGIDFSKKEKSTHPQKVENHQEEPDSTAKSDTKQKDTKKEGAPEKASQICNKKKNLHQKHDGQDEKKMIMKLKIVFLQSAHVLKNHPLLLRHNNQKPPLFP